jgi:hypothetical protein
VSGFFGRDGVHGNVGTRREEGREEGDEGQELRNEESEEVSVSLMSDREAKDMQRERTPSRTHIKTSSSSDERMVKVIIG